MEKKKQVVMLLAHDFIHPYLDPRVYKEAKSLVEKGYAVGIVCWGNRKKDAPIYENYEGIDVFRIFQQIPKGISLLLRIPWYLKYILKSIRQSISLKPDIVHVHDLDTLAIGVLVKLLSRKPLIFDAHEDFPSLHEQVFTKEIGQLTRKYETILIRFADVVIAAEFGYVEVMQRFYNIKPIVIMNLPILKNFNKFVDSSSVITQYKLENKIIISYIGGLGWGRGVEDTIEALAYMKNVESVRFLVVGKATEEHKNKLIELSRRFNVEKNVIFCTNGVEHDKIPMYYAASYISTMILHPLPNWVTSIPTKLYESLATGTPVICGIYPVIKDFVTKHNVGLFADPNNPQEIAEKLDMLIYDKQLHEKMSQNAWKIANEKFNWSNSEKLLLGAYKNLK